MTNEIITIIVPVYKAEQYINRCVDSVLAQTFHNWELLLINDGSPDNSDKICDDCALKDSRIRVFHKSNGGASSARNFGIEKSSAQLITFVDSDDYIDSNYLKCLYMTFEKYRADLTCCGHQKILNDGTLKKKRTVEECICNESKFEEILVEGKLMYQKAPWAKIFKKDILETYNIRFVEGAFTGEDEIFMYTYFLHCNSVAFSECTGYNYVECEGSLTNRGNFPYRNELISAKAFRTIALEVFKKYPRYTWIMRQFTFYCDKLINSIYNDFDNRQKRIELLKEMDIDTFTKWKVPATFFERVFVYLLKFRMFYLYDLLRMLKR